MANDVFPRNNLPPESVPWGRTLEDETRKTGYSITSVGGAIHDNNRSSAGQAGALTQQITDLKSRSTHVIPIGSLLVPVTLDPSPGVYASASGSLTVPIPPPFDNHPRSTLVLFSGVAVNTDPLNVSGFGSSANIKARVGAITSNSMPAPRFTSSPPGYSESFYLNSFMPSTNPLVLEVYVTVSNSSGSTRVINVGLSECTVTVVYQERLA